MPTIYVFYMVFMFFSKEGVPSLEASPSVTLREENMDDEILQALEELKAFSLRYINVVPDSVIDGIAEEMKAEHHDKETLCNLLEKSRKWEVEYLGR